VNGRLPFLAAVLAAFGLSWLVLAKLPSDQAAALAPQREELRDGKIVKVPAPLPGAEAARVYAQNGCFVCHVRKIGPRDLAAGAGRESFLSGPAGFSRTGPDLTDLASRRKKDELVVFLRGHGGGEDAEKLADWLLGPKALKPEPKP